MSPETRHSLVIRVRNRDDQEAWQQFSDIYRPVVQRLAVWRGLQEADAEDLTQRELMAIAGAIDRWEPDADRGKFRTWLRKIADNAILNALRRGVPDRSSGKEEMRSMLLQSPAQDGPDSDLLRIEYRREVFQWAVRQIRHEFTDETWTSFWMTAVDGIDVEAAAARLGRSRGSVYASRSRVMKRLRNKVEEFDDE